MGNPEKNVHMEINLWQGSKSTQWGKTESSINGVGEAG